jgi:protein TonB
MRFPQIPPRLMAILPWAAIAVLLASCSSAPSPTIPNATEVPVIAPPPPSTNPQPPAQPLIIDKRVSEAKTPRDYRKDAAKHLYTLNQARLYPGKMPPLLHAVGVLQVEIDSRGYVTGVSWMRAPRHAPDVMAEIERSVRLAAPFPAPVRMGKVTYTDTWLWHSSGRFQLDTLTEGQL